VKLFPKNWSKAMKNLDWVKDVHCKIQDYNSLVKLEGSDNIVKKNEDEKTVLNFINESFLVRKHLIEESGFKVYMSATIGDPLEYMKNTGIANAKYIRVDNSFKYDKSPILFLKGFKMNHGNKDEMVPVLTKYTDILLDSVEQKTKGIIHTGSYDIAERIERASKNSGRFITYRGSAEKKDALREFEQSENGILIGPSLLEGLDLKDDMSRFQIFFKVPYSSLADPLVKAKLAKSQSWYNYDVTIKILQGIGRSIRSEDDWARTYLMDANFIRVLKSQQLPEHITSRYGSLNTVLKQILEKSQE
jgi:Rad3-related DNA helicase